MPSKRTGSPGLDAERDDVLDLEVDRVADADAVAQSVLHAPRSARARRRAPRRRAARAPPSGRPAARRRPPPSFSICSSVASSSTNMPRRQLPSVMTFGVSAITATLQPADVRALDLTLADVEDERDAAVVVRRTVVERQVARAHEIAGARLEVAALEIPGHIGLPSRAEETSHSRPIKEALSTGSRLRVARDVADPITARTLNRTTLQRQLLLERAPLDALSAVHRLVGLQAQVPANPYPGLWSRLEWFRTHPTSGSSLVERQVVRIASIRGTIHLLTADDCLGFWPLFRPVFDRELAAHPEVGAGPRRRRSRSGPRVGDGRCWARSRSPSRVPRCAGRALPRARRGRSRVRVPEPPRPRAGSAARAPRPLTSGHGDDGRGVARRPLAASPSVDDLVAPLPARVRPGDGGGHRNVVPADRHRGRPRPPRRRSSGNGRTRRGERCGMSRTASWPIPGRPRRCGSCPSTTTCSSPTPTAPASSTPSPPPPSTRPASSGAVTCWWTGTCGDRGGSQTAASTCCTFRSAGSDLDAIVSEATRLAGFLHPDDPPAVTVTAV